MSDLVEFLLARISEDERLIERGRAHSALDRCMTPNRIAVMPVDGGWELVLDYERVLAECEAKRHIIELHSATDIGWGPDVIGCATCDDDHGETWGPDLLGPGESLYPCPTIRLLALPYADHPDYRAEWRP